MRRGWYPSLPKSANPPQDALHDFSVRGAERCADRGVVEARVHAYLTSGYWANVPLAEGLKPKERDWVGPTDVPLDDIDRQCGPEEGMPYREPAELWERRVGQLLATAEDVRDPPPLIVHSSNGTRRNRDGTLRFVVADGAHRLEALKRSGRASCHALIWFETAEQRDEYLRWRGDRIGSVRRR